MKKWPANIFYLSAFFNLTVIVGAFVLKLLYCEDQARAIFYFIGSIFLAMTPVIFIARRVHMDSHFSNAKMWGRRASVTEGDVLFIRFFVPYLMYGAQFIAFLFCFFIFYSSFIKPISKGESPVVSCCTGSMKYPTCVEKKIL